MPIFFSTGAVSVEQELQGEVLLCLFFRQFIESL